VRGACGLARRRPAALWTVGAAAAALGLAILIHSPTSREKVVAGVSRGLNALTLIERVEAGADTSVFVLQTPKEGLRIIWVVEPRPRTTLDPPPASGTPGRNPQQKGSEIWPSAPAARPNVASASPLPAC
jgi:hypothetical protein